jgi:hypothetical protein
MNRTRRYRPIAPFLSVVLLTGVRFGEASNLRWDDVDLDALNERGETVGEIQLRAAATKTDIERRVDLGVCPAVRAILEKLKRRTRPGDYVFGGAAPMSRHRAEASRRRLMSATYGAPPFDWQQLRQTCSSVLTNSAGIYGAASAYRSAAQLGHGIDVAQRHYLGVLRGIPATAHTVEDAMGIVSDVAEVVADVVRIVEQVSEGRDDAAIVECGVEAWPTSSTSRLNGVLVALPTSWIGLPDRGIRGVVRPCRRSRPRRRRPGSCSSMGPIRSPATPVESMSYAS